ncbi:hypothetical protein SAMN04515695_4834 [Pseudovibrio sp. Tun.PSC04-5.I4]|nr:hypothetical protein SAMN04515695_4834 [Pseudovibrio sp. Tun.PSC04-5.I4]
MAHVLGILQSKGGTGKSTLAVSITGSLALEDTSAILVDTDKLVLSRLRSSLFRAIFAMKEIRNGKEIHSYAAIGSLIQPARISQACSRPHWTKYTAEADSCNSAQKRRNFSTKQISLCIVRVPPEPNQKSYAYSYEKYAAFLRE